MSQIEKIFKASFDRIQLKKNLPKKTMTGIFITNGGVKGSLPSLDTIRKNKNHFKSMLNIKD